MNNKNNILEDILNNFLIREILDEEPSLDTQASDLSDSSAEQTLYVPQTKDARQLANMAVENSGGNFTANQSQGKIKEYPFHARIAATEDGKTIMLNAIAKFAAGETDSKKYWKKLYSSPSQASEFINDLKAALGSPPGLTFGSLVGIAGQYSSGFFPAIEVTFTSKASEQPVSIPLVATIPGKRTSKGTFYQDETKALIGKKLKAEGYTMLKAPTAKKGSQVIDVAVTAKKGNKTISFNIEVKGPGGKFFDRTMKRGYADTRGDRGMINRMAAVLAANNNINLDPARKDTLTNYIDELIKKGEHPVGYSGDKTPAGDPQAAPGGGSLPTEYFEMPVNRNIIRAIRKHWEEGGDQYFAVSNSSGTDVSIWWTGTGTTARSPENYLRAPAFTETSMTGNISLTTSGTVKNGIRVTFTAGFNHQTAMHLTEGKKNFNNRKDLIFESILIEELTRSDKKEIKKIIKREIESNKSQLMKDVQAEVEKELKKALGKDFFGSPDKIKSAVRDISAEEINKGLKSKPSQDLVADVAKKVLKKFYKELSWSHSPIIDRIKL